MANRDEFIKNALEFINSTRSAQRIRGAKLIRKNGLTELKSELYAAFLKELKDARTWEVKSEMLKTLGALKCDEAMPQIWQIVERNLAADAVTSSATTAYIRLKRAHKDDAREIINLLKTGSYSVALGALTALAIDQMSPSEAEILEILRLSRDIHKHEDRRGREFGLIDPRVYVAIASANWLGGVQGEAVREWLNYCKVTAIYHAANGEERVNLRLVEICETVLKGKIPKGYIEIY
ncbi:MAG: hypothetical protein LUC34_00570 [Campylobacter sp.]|nr:hypothetical protein [Campylobacter sp.]